MTKIACLVLCLVAASVSHVNAKITDEEKAAIRESIKPAFEECSTKFSVSKDDLKAAKEAGNSDGINPCFVGCMLKKTGMMDAEGKIDHDAAVAQMKKFISDSEQVAMFDEVGKKCAAVNDKEVSDGAEGCERAKLLVDCLIENKADFML